MSKLLTALFAGALFGSSYVALAVEAQPMEDSTHPNSVNDVPVENARQEPDRNRSSANRTSRSGQVEYNDEYSDSAYMDRWSESSGGSGSVGGTGTNNPNSNADMSGADQIEKGNQGDVEKLRQKPQAQ